MPHLYLELQIIILMEIGRKAGSGIKKKMEEVHFPFVSYGNGTLGWDFRQGERTQVSAPPPSTAPPLLKANWPQSRHSYIILSCSVIKLRRLLAELLIRSTQGGLGVQS